MPPFALLSDEELKAQLATLQSGAAPAGKSLRSKRVQLDLQVYQIELEMQNRELRETQQELEVARDRYADLYDFAPVGYLTFDPKGYIRELNLTGAAILGTERLHIVDQPFTAWLQRGETLAFFTHLREVAKTGRGTVVLRIRGPGGNRRIIRLESAPEKGKFRGCRSAMTDITEAERRDLAEREREAEFAHLARISTLGAMASTIAHEIAQPLTAIVGYASKALTAIRKEPGNPEAIADTLEKVVLVGQRVGEIVHSISDFSRKGEALRAPIELNTIVYDANHLVASAAQDRNIDIELVLAEDLPAVVGNSVQLEQVVVNLVMNALDSIEAHGGELRRVTVRTALAGSKVQLSVSDTGGGVTPEVVERMFKPFFSTKQQGHGIGLALCRTIIQSHGGHIWATPNDGGATVSFDLPVRRE
jgi:C4-dicarboxylate-specific signal transduction histidine kinase